MMEVMLDAKMSNHELLTEMASLLLAGHDSLSVTFNFFMYNLAVHQEHQEQCREEVDKMFSGNDESSLFELTMDNLSELRYMERCIKESLRIYPTVPLISRELGSPLKLDNDLDLGAGVAVLVSPWTLHRHPDYYPNPEKYDPDRFLAENCRNRSSFAYIPFSGGPRNCIGWKLGMMEIKVLAAYILRHFEVHTNTSPHAVKLKFNIVMGTENNLNIFLKRRQ